MYHPAPRRPISRGPSPAPGAAPDAYYNTPNAGYGAAMPRPRSRAASPAPPAMMGGAGPYGQPQNPYGGPNAAYGATMPRPRSRAASPAPPAMMNMPGAPAPTAGFQVEKRAKSPNPYGRPTMPQAGDPYRDDAVYQERVATFLLAKDEQFAVAGRIPVDPTQLSVFFRTKSGITHSLDFPIDVTYNNPPALDVLIESCRPHQLTNDPYANPYGGAPAANSQALFFPPTLPLSTSLELANYPILDAVRSALFPELAAGVTLTAIRDRLDVVDEGGRLPLHAPAALKSDGRAATLVITLPAKFRGGSAIVRDPRLADVPASEEKFIGGGGKNGDLDWVAFRSDCEFEVETVTKGCRLSLAYAVFIKPPVHAAAVQMPGQPQGAAYQANPNAEPLAIPSDRFFDLMSPIMNMSRGKSVAFFLNYDYGVNPAEVKANEILPRLKGADALLYDAFKFYKLEPQVHWTAGGFIWDVDSTLEYFGDALEQGPPSRHATPAGGRFGNPARRTPAADPYSPYGGAPAGGDIAEAMRQRVQASGAVTLAEAGVTLLTDFHNPTPPKIGKEKVYFVSDGELQKLVVNALLVVFIP